MKILIWIGCILTSALIYGVFGLQLGGVPAVMFFGSTVYIAKKFVFRYENQENKNTQEYAENTKGLMKGFVWYGASILYVILGTICNPNIESFDWGTQIILMILCIGAACAGHWYIDKKAILKTSNEPKVKSAKVIQANSNSQFCQKCGTKLEKDSKFCHKCGTKIEIARKIICNECNRDLPDGSEFCPYCGIKIEPSEAVISDGCKSFCADTIPNKDIVNTADNSQCNSAHYSNSETMTQKDDEKNESILGFFIMTMIAVIILAYLVFFVTNF